MPFTQWLQPPRRALALFLGLMLVLGGALSWLAWQVLQQDRSLQRQRAQEHLEQAADRMAAALQHSLSDLENYASLPAGRAAKEAPEGVAVLVATERGLNAYPPGRLLYYPAIPASQEPPPATFAEGEQWEYRRNDPAKASQVFRALAQSANRGVRAAALLRLARTLRKTGRHQQALEAYAELAQLGSTPVMALPAELVAGEARCTVLEATGRREELRKEASLLYSALRSGRGTCGVPPGSFTWKRPGDGPRPVPGRKASRRASRSPPPPNGSTPGGWRGRKRKGAAF